MKRWRNAIHLVTVATTAVAVAACGSSSIPITAPSAATPQVLAGFDTAKRQGCFSCHQVQGHGGKAGPSFDNGKASVQLDDGTTVAVDTQYLRRAIAEPDTQIPQGYRKGIMSAALASRGKLSDQQIDDLVAYLQAVQTEAAQK